MNVWAIADLHLSFARPERRERYAAGGVTMRPGSRLSGRRRSSLRTSCFCPAICPWPGTTVNYSRIWPGWRHCREPRCSRPGTTTPGGTASSEIRPLLRRSLRAVGGDALEVGGVIVCGTRGVGPASDGLPPEQQAVIDHEVGELRAGAGTGSPAQNQPRAATLPPLALPSVRRLRQARSLGGSLRGGGGLGLRLRSSAHAGPVVACGSGKASRMSATTASRPMPSVFDHFASIYGKIKLRSMTAADLQPTLPEMRPRSRHETQHQLQAGACRCLW